MAGEVKEYVSVSEKDFWQRKSMELTVNGRVLDSNLQKVIAEKVADLNAKIDNKYDAWISDFKGTENISDSERKILADQLKEVVKWFNELIAKLDAEYIGKTQENQWQIKTEVSSFFSDKNIFVTKGQWLASIAAYAGMNREAAAPVETKKMSLN